MEWGILAIVIIFIAVGYIELQGTRASLAWRKAAAGGDVEVIRQMLEETISSWRSMKRPKEVALDVWRGVQSIELVDVAADSARVSCQVESEYRMLEGRWVEVSNPLQGGMAVTAHLADMLIYDVPNLRLASVRIDVYTTFRNSGGASDRARILTTNAQREVAREVDWESWTPAEIVDAFGGRYRLGERGGVLDLGDDEGAEAPAVGSPGVQADR